MDWIEEKSTEFAQHYPDGAVGIFQRCLYQALSKAAIHPDIYFFTPKGVEPRHESV
jgi:hypothetical protein